ncbi:hypothetical protein AQUCO_02800061v1 [Aquilegia coerulea]|uniref:Uncharacterized protein n=1 Tax=Aquilegia coerulea TaxID=218851 RepID=A0A2G5D3R2_AQUCA|nr:hypothetical protein AQUCO_02800061v1 [Aquilegia coerulea]
MANITTSSIAYEAWICIGDTSITSNGLFRSDINPLYYSTTIILLQSSLATFMGCITAALFLPLGVPSMVTQLMAGMSLGPTLLGRIKNFPTDIFPPRSYIPLHTYSDFGTVMHIFLMGVQMDITTAIRPGKKGVITGISVVVVPLALTTLWTLFLTKSIIDETGKLSNYLTVVGKVESLATFPVIAGYLIELNILNTEFSNLAFSASMISGVLGNMIVGDIMGNRHKKDYKTEGAVGAMSLSYLIVVILTIVLLAPTIRWIIKKTPDGQMVKQDHLNVVLSLIFLTVYICFQGSLHILFPPFIAGLIIPSGPPLGSALLEKFDFFSKWMVMPIFYATHASMMADIFEIPLTKIFLVGSLIFVSFIGKFLGAFLPAVFFNMSYKDATLLGLTMNTQGFLEVLLFATFADKEIIDAECFTIMCFSLIILTGGSAPLVRYLYKSTMKYNLHNRRTIQDTVPNSELRVLGCVYEEDNVPSMIHVLRATNPTKENPIYLSIIHFVELVGRTTPLVISHKVHRNLPSAAAVSQHIVNVFKSYEDSNKGIISVHPYTIVSNFPSMHNDVCKLAFHKRTSLILLPYHKNLATGSINPGIRTVNCEVLNNSPCSVGILIDRGLQNGGKFLFTNWVSYHVVVVFLGGADDREALAHAKRMSEHPAILLTVFRFLPSSGIGTDTDTTERNLDDAVVEEFKLETTSNHKVSYIEEEVEEGLGVIKVINSFADKYELIIVGRRHDEKLPFIIDLTDWNKCSELGTIGDIFTVSGYGGKATILVIQQQSKGSSLFLQSWQIETTI